MIMIMENAALNAIRAYLDLGESAVGTAVLGCGGLVADERLAGVEGERLQAGIDDRPVLRWAAHHRRPNEKARLEGREWPAVAVAIASVISVHEDIGAVQQFGIDPARRLELETADACLLSKTIICYCIRLQTCLDA